MNPLPAYAEATPAGLRMRLRVTPKAARDGVDGPQTLSDGSDVLAVRVRAVADKGAANKAVAQLVAKWLGVAPSTVEVARGTTARVKILTVAGTPGDLAATLCERSSLPA